jgi:hypothetical protein
MVALTGIISGDADLKHEFDRLSFLGRRRLLTNVCIQSKSGHPRKRGSQLCLLAASTYGDMRILMTQVSIWQ